jgi:Uma2 family endonuclease
MTIATRPSPLEIRQVRGDIRTIHRNRTWEHFEHIQKGFEHTRGIRLFYFNGTIEILMLGIAHELFKTIIGMLIETFLLDHNQEFLPTGSATQQKEGVASAEADESYEIGNFRLAIEVNFTSGDTSKLEIYQALGTHEVWIWEDGVLEVYHLQANGYTRVSQSQIPELAAIDLKVMTECILIGETSRVQAVQRLRSNSKFKRLRLTPAPE